MLPEKYVSVANNLPVSWMLLAPIVWFLFHNFLFGHERIIERVSKQFFYFSRFVPAIFLFASASGIMEAEKLPTNHEYIFEIGGEKKIAVLGRSYDKYFLTWDTTTERIEFISTETVNAFYKLPKFSKSNTLNAEQ